MTGGLLRRLRRMDREEILFRARVVALAEAGRLASAWKPTRWRREALAGCLRGTSAEAREAVNRLRRGNYGRAHDALLRHLVTRPASFPLAPRALAGVAREVEARFPEALADARARADRVLSGRFDLLGYEGLRFEHEGPKRAGDAARLAVGRIDWGVDPVHQRRPPREWWSRVPFLDPAFGDHKIIWELNRHQHWLALGRAAWLTGDPRYRAEFVAQLEDWMGANPPHQGINWASMLELSLRCLTWVWSLHAFAQAEPGSTEAGEEPPWTVDLLLGVREQMNHVEKNLSTYFSPNTHLTGEALGLYVCGRALPELDAAPRWAAVGREVLLAQIGRQVLPDGGHCERSAHYHRYTLDFYLLALAVARTTGDSCAGTLAKAVERLAEAARLLSDQGGHLPSIGDDDGGSLFPIRRRAPSDIRDSLALAAVLLERPDLAIGPSPEEPLWLLGRTTGQDDARGRAEAKTPLFVSGALAETGYFVSRPGRAQHVVIDAGPHGYLNGGHAHADALSLTMALDGQPLLVDPGTGSYTASATWRDRLRSTPLHNTLTLGERSQSIAAGPFHWRSTAASTLQRWCTGEGIDYFEGVHDGYLPQVHRRRVVTLEDGLLVVVDSVLGDGIDQADVHWHIAPGWSVQGDPDEGRQVAESASPAAARVESLLLRHPTGACCSLALAGGEVERFNADEETGLGWCSPVYGRIVPCTTVRLRARARLPMLFVSVLDWRPGQRPDAVTIVPGELDGRTPAAGDDSVGVRLRRDGREDLLLFAWRAPVLGPAPAQGEAEPRPPVTAFECGDDRIETDARFLHLRRGTQGLVREVSALDGGHVRSSASPDPLLSAGPSRGWTTVAVRRQPRRHES